MATLLGTLNSRRRAKVIALSSTEVGELVENMGLEAFERKLALDKKEESTFYVYHSNGVIPYEKKAGMSLNYALYLLVMTGLKGRSLLKEAGFFSQRVFTKEASCFISVPPVQSNCECRPFDIIVLSNTRSRK